MYSLNLLCLHVVYKYGLAAGEKNVSSTVTVSMRAATWSTLKQSLAQTFAQSVEGEVTEP